MTTLRTPAFIAYTSTGKGRNALWTRIGAAWLHNNGGGYTIDLAALPPDGRLVLLPPGMDAETIQIVETLQ